MTSTVSSLPVRQNNEVSSRPVFSFEFFPAKTPRMERNLWRTMGQLELLNPAYFSMTYGALGSERDYSLNMVSTMVSEGRVPVAAHLTAAGHTRESLLELVRHFNSEGVERIVALRGDAELVEGGITDVAVMVEEILQVADFDISVAAYPEVHPKAAGLQADLAHLKRKLDAGAKRALTQYFFDAEVFLRFRDEAEKIGINQPIVPGILPVHDFDKVKSFSARCGANVPAFMEDLFAGTEAGSYEQRQIGIEHATQLCETLHAEGVNEFHFYTLNLPNLSFEVARNLLGQGDDIALPVQTKVAA
ncbi:MAG: methylenetetrahydrofolate reductase [Thiolinea sp.]